MMDKRSIMAVMLSLVIWMGWQKFYLEPIQKQAEAQKQQIAEAQRQSALAANPTTEVKVGESSTTKSTQPEKKREAASVQLENSDSRVVVTNDSTTMQSWDLKSFSRTMEKKDEKIVMSEITGFPAQVGLRFSDPNLTKSTVTTWDSIEKVGEDSAVAKLTTPDMKVERRFTLNSKGFGGKVDYTFQFSKEVPKFVFLDLYGSPKRENDKEGSIFGQAPDKVHVNYRDASGRHSELAASHQETKESAAGVKWIGLDTRYFVLALVPQGTAETVTGAQVAVDESRLPAVRGTLVFPTDGKNSFSVSTKVYFGPKEIESLKAVDPVLVDTIDFGWTSFLAVPLLHSLKWLYDFVGNYGLAIIVLTFMIKMLLLPLTYKSMKSMSKISKLQPQLNALREKYKDDKEKLNVEMMNFMKTNGYNPVGGCLPILIQMPIFFALYRVLFNSMELYQAPFIGWIHDLSSPDPFFITPILLCGLMFLQQKLSPNTATDPVQQKMLQFMPLMFGVFMLLLPAGLNIYMVVNSATSIAQQAVLNRKLGITKTVPAKA